MLIFNICLKESCFPDFWKVISVDHVFKKVGEMLDAKTYQHEIHFIFSKHFEKLTNDKLTEYPGNGDQTYSELS